MYRYSVTCVSRVLNVYVYVLFSLFYLPELPHCNSIVTIVMVVYLHSAFTH